MGSQARNWCFTINNPSEEIWHTLNNLMLPGGEPDTRILYMIFQQEKGTNGTEHLQGVIMFHVRMSLGVVRNLLGGTAHLEVMRGRPSQAIAYCSKSQTRMKDGGPFIYGKLESGSKGSTTDWNYVKELLLKGTSMRDISTMLFTLWLRYAKNFKEFLTLHRKKTKRSVTLTIHYGETGTGKTASIWNKYENTNDLFILANQHGKTIWWDGYEQEKAVLIDEFYGWIPFDQLLRITDVYPCKIQYKGGMDDLTATDFHITSNKPWEDWYPNVFTFEEHRLAFKRRISKIIRYWKTRDPISKKMKYFNEVVYEGEQQPIDN